MTKTKESEHQTKNGSPTYFFAENAFYMRTIFLIITLFLTVASTLIMSVSLMSDYWEYMTWNEQKIRDIIENEKPTYYRNHIRIKTFLNDNIIKLLISHIVGGSAALTRLYLLPMHGGIWTVCVSLTEKQSFVLKQIEIPSKMCFNYLSAKLFKAEFEPIPDWNYRLQNVSISCALVCLIILMLAVMIGIFGILKHQLMAILVTGVMYLLAGVFASFTILINHVKKFDYKRNNYDSFKSMRITMDNDTKLMDNGILQQHKATEIDTDFSHIWKPFYVAREFHAGSSSNLGIIGVVFIAMTSILWIVLAKMLRYTPRLTQE